MEVFTFFQLSAVQLSYKLLLEGALSYNKIIPSQMFLTPFPFKTSYKKVKAHGSEVDVPCVDKGGHKRPGKDILVKGKHIQNCVV